MTRSLALALTALSLFIHGCGGGGDSSEPPKGPPPVIHDISGTLTGLEAGTLVLRLSASATSAQTLSLTTDGAFQFNGGVPNGSSYTVAVTTTPANHSCTVENATGTASADVNDVEVTCEITSTSISGVAQKGPFEIGSEVIAYELDADLERTGRRYETLITDARGGFVLDVDFLGDVVEIEVTGHYLDEWHDAMSTQPMTLRAYAQLQHGDTIFVAVNALSKLASNRVQKLVSVDGLALSDAVAQARAEVFDAFDIEYTDDDLTGEPDFLDGEGAAALLLGIIVTPKVTTGSTDTVARIAVDLADNGVVDEPYYLNLTKGNRPWIRPTDIVASLTRHATSAGITDFSAPNFLPVLGDLEVWFEISGTQGAGLSVWLEGYPKVAIEGDGNYLLGVVPRSSFLNVEHEYAPTDRRFECLNIGGKHTGLVETDVQLVQTCRPVVPFVLIGDGIDPSAPVGLVIDGHVSVVLDWNGPQTLGRFVAEGTAFTFWAVDRPDCVIDTGPGHVTATMVEANEIPVTVTCRPYAAAMLVISGVPDASSLGVALQTAPDGPRVYLGNGTHDVGIPLFEGDAIDIVRSLIPIGWVGTCEVHGDDGTEFVSAEDTIAGVVEIEIVCTEI